MNLCLSIYCYYYIIDIICNKPDIMNYITISTQLLLLSHCNSSLLLSNNILTHLLYDVDIVKISDNNIILSLSKNVLEYFNILIHKYNFINVTLDKINKGNEFLTMSSVSLRPTNIKLEYQLYVSAFQVLSLIINNFDNSIYINYITDSVLLLFIQNGYYDLLNRILSSDSDKIIDLTCVFKLNSKIFRKLFDIIKGNKNEVKLLHIIFKILSNLSKDSKFSILFGRLGLVELLFSFYLLPECDSIIKIELANVLCELFQFPQNRSIASHNLSLEIVEFIRLLDTNNREVIKSVLNIANSLSLDSDGFQVLIRYKTFIYGLIQYTYHIDKELQLISTEIINRWITSSSILKYIDISLLFYLLQCDLSSMVKHILFVIYKKLDLMTLPLANRIIDPLHIGYLYFKNCNDADDSKDKYDLLSKIKSPRSSSYKLRWCILTPTSLYICKLKRKNTNSPPYFYVYKDIKYHYYNVQMNKDDQHHFVVEFINRTNHYLIFDPSNRITKNWSVIIKQLNNPVKVNTIYPPECISRIYEYSEVTSTILLSSPIEVYKNQSKVNKGIENYIDNIHVIISLLQSRNLNILLYLYRILYLLSLHSGILESYSTILANTIIILLQYDEQTEYFLEYDDDLDFYDDSIYYFLYIYFIDLIIRCPYCYSFNSTSNTKCNYCQMDVNDIDKNNRFSDNTNYIVPPSNTVQQDEDSLWTFIHKTIKSECSTAEEVEKEGIVLTKSIIRRCSSVTSDNLDMDMINQHLQQEDSQHLITPLDKEKNKRKRHFEMKSLPSPLVEATNIKKSPPTKTSPTFVSSVNSKQIYQSNAHLFEGDGFLNSLKESVARSSSSILEDDFDDDLNISDSSFRDLNQSRYVVENDMLNMTLPRINLNEKPKIYLQFLRNTQLLGCEILTNMLIDHNNNNKIVLSPLIPDIYDEVLITKLLKFTRSNIPMFKISSYKALNQLFGVSKQYGNVIISILCKHSIAKHIYDDFNYKFTSSSSVIRILLYNQLLQFLLNISNYNNEQLMKSIYDLTDLFTEIITLWKKSDNEIYPLCQQFLECYFGSGVDIYKMKTEIILPLLTSKSFSVVSTCIKHCSYIVSTNSNLDSLLPIVNSPLDQILKEFPTILSILQNTVINKVYTNQNMNEFIALLLSTIWGLLQYNESLTRNNNSDDIFDFYDVNSRLNNNDSKLNDDQLSNCFILLVDILLKDDYLVDDANKYTLLEIIDELIRKTTVMKSLFPREIYSSENDKYENHVNDIILYNFFTINTEKYSLDNQLLYYKIVLELIKSSKFIMGYFISNSLCFRFKGILLLIYLFIDLLRDSTDSRLLNILLKIYLNIFKSDACESIISNSETLLLSMSIMMSSESIGRNKLILLLCFYALFNRNERSNGIYKALYSILKRNKDFLNIMLKDDKNQLCRIITCIYIYCYIIILRFNCKKNN